LADAKDVLAAIRDVEGASFPVLTPNLKVRIIVNGKYIYNLWVVMII
jgi:hypothetical protein